jgi:hypothetical protein
MIEKSHSGRPKAKFLGEHLLIQDGSVSTATILLMYQLLSLKDDFPWFQRHIPSISGKTVSGHITPNVT